MTRILEAFAAALVAVAVGCSTPATSAPASPGSITADATAPRTWAAGSALYTRLRAPDRTVVVSLSPVVMNSEGRLCRIVSVTDVYDPGNAAGDNDLNGLIFADAPVLITPSTSADDLRHDLQAYWPQRGGLTKLYGMGFDAYRLIGSLYNDSRAAWPVRGMSGDLSLDTNGRIHRGLPLAQFRNGKPAEYLLPVAGSRELVGTR